MERRRLLRKLKGKVEERSPIRQKKRMVRKGYLNLFLEKREIKTSKEKIIPMIWM